MLLCFQQFIDLKSINKQKKPQQTFFVICLKILVNVPWLEWHSHPEILFKVLLNLQRKDEYFL